MCGCGISAPCFGGCPCGCSHTAPADVRYRRDRNGFVGGPDPENHNPGARPVVVIGPGDRKAVERLMTFYAGSPLMEDEVPDMQRALREFAEPTPPKPDEPMGLGAVIEDREGRRWVRARETTTAAHWKRSDGFGQRLAYDKVCVVRVLSHGVTDESGGAS